MVEDVIISESGSVLTAHLMREIDHHLAGRMREKIDNALFRVKPSRLVLDFSEVGFMDSSGIGLILGRVESARAVCAEVRLVGLSAALLKLVRLAGLERVRGLSIGVSEDGAKHRAYEVKG